MKFESKKITINEPQVQVFQELAQPANYQALMPENTQFHLYEDGQGFDFQLSGMPRVGLRLKEAGAPNYILFESPNESFNYEMRLVLEPVSDAQTQVYIDFSGKFNPMIEMMVKRPLSNFLERLMDNLAQNKG
ncbi:SRPBCC family protein [Ornithobacterium rhinotracheale]|uniref:SRPBCC family protein n=1 Tax=Ornithobacterium rhinotracheale TaxID=28251 RepID=A0A3R5URM7_ORNRH|nr:SRPBCC family protein [Ornithobacterium rhinotracheale]QAR30611.1 SRPBCC family protein [Ornithobacterium rhinotracheale]